METNIYATNQGSPCLTSAKCTGTPKAAKYEEYRRNIEEQKSPSEFQDVLLEPEMSLLSVSSILDHSETSLQPGGTAECVSATNQSEAERLCEELLSSERHKPKEEALNFTSHTEWPLLAGENPAKKPEMSHEIRVVRHKPSAITFSDFEFLSHEANTKLHISEAGEEDFSSEEEEADGRGDDDLFTELPLYEAFFNGLHRTDVFPRKQAKCELTEYPHICHLEDCDDNSKAESKDHDKEEEHTELETQSEKRSEWSDSMSCLMKKLEQLNLDIEEALSASSSPSSTPSTTRHKELCPAQVETSSYRDHQGKGPWKHRSADYQDLNCLPYPVSTGARPKPYQNKPVINHILRKESESEISEMEVHRINQITCICLITGRTWLDSWAVTSDSPLGSVTMCVFILLFSIFSGTFLPWISVLLASRPQTASETLSNIGMCVPPSIPLISKPIVQ